MDKSSYWVCHDCDETYDHRARMEDAEFERIAEITSGGQV